MVETILTGERSDADIKQEVGTSLDWQRFQILLDICYEHYISVDTNPDLAKFCRMVVTIGKDFKGSELDHIPSKGRDRLTGEVIRKAVNYDHSRKTDGKIRISNKTVFKSLVKELVEFAYKEGHSKNKTSQTGTPTAYEIVADLLYKYGIRNGAIKHSTDSISNWCY